MQDWLTFLAILHSHDAMKEPDNAELLADLLINAEKELRSVFMESPELEESDRDNIRRETYLTSIRLWLASKP